MFSHSNADITITAHDVLEWSKQIAAGNRVVLRFEREGRDLDVLSVFSNRDLLVVIIPALVTEHSWEDVVIHSAEAAPVGRQSSIIDVEVFLAEIFLHLW